MPPLISDRMADLSLTTRHGVAFFPDIACFALGRHIAAIFSATARSGGGTPVLGGSPAVARRRGRDQRLARRWPASWPTAQLNIAKRRVLSPSALPPVSARNVLRFSPRLLSPCRNEPCGIIDRDVRPSYESSNLSGALSFKHRVTRLRPGGCKLLGTAISALRCVPAGAMAATLANASFDLVHSSP